MQQHPTRHRAAVGADCDPPVTVDREVNTRPASNGSGGSGSNHGRSPSTYPSTVRALDPIPRRFLRDCGRTDSTAILIIRHDTL